jgi:hypothetical protein
MVTSTAVKNTTVRDVRTPPLNTTTTRRIPRASAMPVATEERVRVNVVP